MREPDVNRIHLALPQPPLAQPSRRPTWRKRAAAGFWALLLAALPALLFALPAWAQAGAQQADGLAAISPQLERQLAAAEAPVSFLVILDEQVDARPWLEAAGAASLDRTDRAAALYAALTARAQSSQAPLRAWLDAHGIAYRPFYIVNMIEVLGDATVAQELRRFAQVDRLAANPLVAGAETVHARASWLHEIAPTVPATSAQATSVQATSLQATVALPYGLTYTRAPEVWALGFRGQGIVVASQDTGVQWDHPALKASYRGWDAQQSQASHAYNWFDAWGSAGPSDPCTGDPQVPCDDEGHGTHTVGTMLGDSGASGPGILGMAPGAQWIGCRNMLDGEGTPASYAACFQFMLAPYPQGGDPFTDGRPELAPHVVNNSWSCPPEEGCDIDSLRRVVETVRSAGLFVVASAGNYGRIDPFTGLPVCSTVQYPIAIYDAVFSVGAHDSSGDLAYFSSRGPVAADGSHRLKPDLTAPGVAVFSAYRGDAYDTLSGTSMSAPHTAGAVALLWSAAPELIGDVDLTEQALIKSATPVLDSACLPGGMPASPNPSFGYGRLDVYAAVTLAQKPWQAAVRVLDAAGDPNDGVKVIFVDKLTGYTYRAQTGFDGIARLPRILAGRYTLRVGEGNGRVQPLDITLDLAAGERRYTRQVADPTFLPLLIRN